MRKNNDVLFNSDRNPKTIQNAEPSPLAMIYLKRAILLPLVVLTFFGSNQPARAEDKPPPLWISCALYSKEVLIFPRVYNSKDGRSYVLIEEAERIRSEPVVRAAAVEIVRANYDVIVPMRFTFHLGAHVFINGAGEPLLAIDTTSTPPSLTISRPYLLENRIYLGRTARSPQTVSDAYYQRIADQLEVLQPDLAIIARRELKLVPGTPLRKGFELATDPE